MKVFSGAALSALLMTACSAPPAAPPARAIADDRGAEGELPTELYAASSGEAGALRIPKPGSAIPRQPVNRLAGLERTAAANVRTLPTLSSSPPPTSAAVSPSTTTTPPRRGAPETGMNDAVTTKDEAPLSTAVLPGDIVSRPAPDRRATTSVMAKATPRTASAQQSAPRADEDPADEDPQVSPYSPGRQGVRSAPARMAEATPPGPSAPQSAAPSRPSPRGGAYAVHLASYRQQANAVAGWDTLRTAHGDILGQVSPFLARVTLPEKGDYIRLFVGPFADKAAADSLCSQFEARNTYCRVMQTPRSSLS
ncbi:hypothetical protein PB2503_12734 [Parvularcula bermudensis HTCC2503]|uniref:SPOR domain-containing protein n=1 Tax=Parvularcula bermudensis (strain ATCC BAA-594 / HTCC2503 / KCTC 12087) TaxID=314260 RepID=E0TFM4_PARBH|nr:SPOR domain-containing protein [Parvularcula bermudensis]ADM10584.1 hypothetical protein PB2503_12734 [Parvularcula bermudensis HTCC2503]